MILLIPISAFDARLIPDLTKALLHCGSLHKHNIRIVPTASVVGIGNKLAEDLKPICDRIKVVPLELDPDRGWPRACTVHWQKAFIAMAREGLREEVYWFEADNTPLCAGWLDKLYEEYHTAKRAFMGTVVTTWRTNPQGVLFQAGEHMVGTGIYPPSWYGNWSNYLTVPFNEPFDTNFQDEWLLDCQRTNLICHMGKTGNYRREAGQIVCDDRDMPSGVSYNHGPVPPEAVVVHGCKDGSLARLICGVSEELDVPPPPQKRRGRPPKSEATPESVPSWEALTTPTAAP